MTVGASLALMDRRRVPRSSLLPAAGRRVMLPHLPGKRRKLAQRAAQSRARLRLRVEERMCAQCPG